MPINTEHNVASSFNIPLHPTPFEDESLTSYLRRLAIANHYPIGFFYKTKDNKQWDFSLRKAADFEFLSHTRVIKREMLDKLTLRRYPVVFHVWDDVFYIFEYLFMSKKLRVCPLCLKEALYYRLHWYYLTFPPETVPLESRI